MIRLESPARISDALRLYEWDLVPTSMRKFVGGPRAVMMHVASGLSWCAYSRDLWNTPIAAGGLIPDRAGAFETWFVAGPEARAHLLALVRAAQLTWARLAQDGPIEIRARIAPEWRPGARLAALLGMEKRGRELGMDLWERRHG